MNWNQFFPRHFVGWAASLTALVTGGCVSAHLVHQDPDFTPAALKGGVIAVGGVTVRDEVEAIDDRQTASVIDFLEREIQNRRPELKLGKHAKIKTAIGDEKLDALLDAVRENATLPQELLAAVQKTGADYLVFIVISYNTVDRYVTNHTDIRNIYDEKKVVTGHSKKYHTVAQVKRSVSAEYRVYNTKSGDRVWVSESSNSRTRSRTADSKDGYPAAPNYGAVPTPSRVIRSMTSAAVKELPSPEVSPSVSADVPDVKEPTDSEP